MDENENSLTIVGRKLGYFWFGYGIYRTEGSPALVDPNYDKIYDRECQKNDVIGFWHTHPNFIARPSGQDYKAMKAWYVCFGKPLVCCIEGTDGLKAHWFFDDESDHITGWVKKVGNVFFGIIPTRKQNG